MLHNLHQHMEFAFNKTSQDVKRPPEPAENEKWVVDLAEQVIISHGEEVKADDDAAKDEDSLDFTIQNLASGSDYMNIQLLFGEHVPVHEDHQDKEIDGRSKKQLL